MVNQKVALICIDGWGVGGANSAPEGNAILNAETPWMDEFAKDGSKYAEGYIEIDALPSPSVSLRASWATPRSAT